jgi:cytoplasmic iron level regulating protein YaaA (DUF328/UPF0246 family)
MLVVLSPAKTLDFSPAPDGLPATRPELTKDTAELARTARRLTRADLRHLMGVSDKLADLNFDRFQALDPNCEGGLQAALAFAGDVYEGLDARNLSIDDLTFAQERLRILSGLYGVLRPLDCIQPYRLEMGVSLRTRRGATLYDFWGDRIAKALRAAAEGHDDPTIVNCASLEYFGAVDAKALKRPVVAAHFREEKDGRARIVSFYAKKARGLMARFAVVNRIERAQDLKAFDLEGYRFDAAGSTATDWTFVRPQPRPKPPARTSAREEEPA